MLFHRLNKSTLDSSLDQFQLTCRSDSGLKSSLLANYHPVQCRNIEHPVFKYPAYLTVCFLFPQIQASDTDKVYKEGLLYRKVTVGSEGKKSKL